MSRRFLLAVVFISASGVVHAQPRGAVDWIFLIDTSQSMRGVGQGSRDIFPDVKESVTTFVREAAPGDSVSILTFDRDVQSYGLRDIHSDFDRRELYDTIDNLQANGVRTHLGLALAEGLERSESLMQRNDATRERAIVLFTDGREDVRGIDDPVSIGPNVKRVAISKPWMFFVSLGEHESQLDAFTERTSILKPRDADAIREATETIRKAIAPPPPPPPTPAVISVDVSELDFGSVRPGETSQPREIEITSDKPARVTIALAETSGLSMQSHTVDTPASVTLQLTAAEDAAEGARAATIRVADQQIIARIVVTPPSLLARVAKWLVALLLVIAAAIAFLMRRKALHRLEGELEIVKPHVAADAMFVGLPRLNATEVALSTIVPADALAGSDARLFVKRSGGRKRVWISAAGGSLRVNDVETPVSELYDADTIDIGDARLRFNRAGDSRPHDPLTDSGLDWQSHPTH